MREKLYFLAHRKSLLSNSDEWFLFCAELHKYLNRSEFQVYKICATKDSNEAYASKEQAILKFMIEGKDDELYLYKGYSLPRFRYDSFEELEKMFEKVEI